MEAGRIPFLCERLRDGDPFLQGKVALRVRSGTIGCRVGGQVEVEVLTCREALAALREAWSELWERCAAVTTFQRPECCAA